MSTQSENNPNQKLTDVITDRDVKKAKDNGKYYQCKFSLPVEIEESGESFKSKDGQANIYKHKAYITDPSKRYPTSYSLYMADQPREAGYYLADISMANFQGKMEAGLHYRKVDKATFAKAEIILKQLGIQRWDTEYKVEIYKHELAGSGYQHEAYFIADGKRPETIDCWQRDILKEGTYQLSVEMARIKGQIRTRNVYTFIESFPKEDT